MAAKDPAPFPQKPIVMGNADYVTQATSYVLDPKTGLKSTLYAEGTEENCLIVARNMHAQGLRAEVIPIVGTPQCRLVITFPDLNDNAPEVPITRWSIKTEIEDVDIFTLPEASQEMFYFTPRSRYRRLIVDAVNKGESAPEAIDLVIFPFAEQLFNWLCEGIRSLPITRPTVYRSRSMSWDYADPIIIPTYPSVWTTSALISEFEIPQPFARKLPFGNDELTPPGRVWGWLMLTSDVDDQFGGTFKQDEVVSWVFAPWEPSRFNIIG